MACFKAVLLAGVLVSAPAGHIAGIDKVNLIKPGMRSILLDVWHRKFVAGSVKLFALASAAEGIAAAVGSPLYYAAPTGPVELAIGLLVCVVGALRTRWTLVAGVAPVVAVGAVFGAGSCSRRSTLAEPSLQTSNLYLNTAARGLRFTFEV